MMSRPVICNLNFHTTIGGTQHTLRTILPMLGRPFDLRVVDPYGNAEFQSLVSEAGIRVERVVDLSDRTTLSTRRGTLRLFDYTAACPRYLSAALVFRRFLVSQKVNLVYVNQTKAAAFVALAAPLRVPIVFHCHGASASGLRLVALLGSRISRVVANSPFTGDALLRIGFPPERVVVVTNAIAVDEVLKKSAQAPLCELPERCNPPVILVAHAGIEPNKGTHLAVDALGRLAASGLPGELWIAGDTAPHNLDYLRTVQDAVTCHRLANRVHFLGKRPDIYSVMAIADVVLIPSVVEEGFGRVPAEAMALGKAVVASNRGALPSLVQDGVTGRIFDPDRSDALAEVLSELVRDAGSRDTYGRNGKEAVRKSSDLERYEQELVDVFRICLADK